MQSSALKKDAFTASDSCAAGRSSGVFSIIADELKQVRKLIEQESSDCSEPVRGLVTYTNAVKGKMIRPALVLLSGLACGKVTEKHIRAAAIIEMIHNATLLHDDVVDESKSRRGAATLNHLKGNESAVLLGDFLLSRVIQMCVEMDGRIARTIASAAAKTCEGELRQIAQRGNWELSEPEYIGIIAEKTAALFGAACSLGAMLAGAGTLQMQKLADYGQKTGIAFQITDDLLDLIGEEKKTGKPVGNDLDHNKLTLPLIHFLDSAEKKEKGVALRQINRCKSGTKRDRAALAKKLREYGSVDYARRRAEQFCREAIAALSILGPTRAKDALIDTAEFIVARTA
jgi:octaprenyl-diphosphate synthase